MTNPTASAEARGLARAAKTYEGAGDLDSARKHYLLAAKRYDDVSKSTTDKTERNTQHDLARHLLAKAIEQRVVVGGCNITPNYSFTVTRNITNRIGMMNSDLH